MSMILNKRARYFLFLIFVMITATLQAETSILNAAIPTQPYRGFNLLEKFDVRWNNSQFKEEDFQFIHENGFNFVRLPMDYRTWIQGTDWNNFNEKTFLEIDQAVQWAQKYGIHVCINFHRAPGYTVNTPPEKTSVWTDSETLRVCTAHWVKFAQRYKQVPAEYLSFNLFNEPHGVDEANYRRVVNSLVGAIRTIDPNRPIYIDGLEWGRKPLPGLPGTGLINAVHAYEPFGLTHYKADWVDGSKSWPVPAWPQMQVNSYLYGNSKPNLQQALTLNGQFPAGTRVRIHIGTVSVRATVQAKADTTVIWERRLTTGPGAGEWKSGTFQKEWQIWQNYYDKDYLFTITQSCNTLAIQIADGDWLQFTELGVDIGDGLGERILRCSDTSWGTLQEPISFDISRGKGSLAFLTTRRFDIDWLKQNFDKLRDQLSPGTGLMVQEFGAHNFTPHDVVMRWMEDNLSVWKERGIGWALWNLRGSFGIMDSGRSDVQFKNWHGHKLDQEMLELLQHY